MQLDKLNQWLMLAANIGVISGIAFLAVEISQNTEALGAQSSYNLYLARTNSFRTLAQNPAGLADLFAREQVGEALAPGERFRLNMYGMAIAGDLEWQYGEILAGRVERPPYLADQWASLAVSVPTLLNALRSEKRFLNQDFAAFVDAEVLPRAEQLAAARGR
jgi:hypothetical protein